MVLIIRSEGDCQCSSQCSSQFRPLIAVTYWWWNSIGGLIQRLNLEIQWLNFNLDLNFESLNLWLIFSHNGWVSIRFSPNEYQAIVRSTSWPFDHTKRPAAVLASWVPDLEVFCFQKFCFQNFWIAFKLTKRAHHMLDIVQRGELPNTSKVCQTCDLPVRIAIPCEFAGKDFQIF